MVISSVIAQENSVKTEKKEKNYSLALKGSWETNKYTAGMSIGYGKTFPNKLYTNLELGVDYTNDRDMGMFKTEINGRKISADKPHHYELAAELTPKLGYDFGQVIVYGLIGAKLKREKTEISVYDNGTKGVYKNMSRKFQLAPGVGADFKLTESVSLGVEGKYYITTKDTKDRKYKTTFNVKYHF